MIERPLDFLNDLKGEKVLIKIKGEDKLLSGQLIAFDIHINLIVRLEEGLTFIKGDNVL